MYDVYYAYFNDDCIASHEYYDSFDNYEEALKAVDDLNRDPDCIAYIKERTDKNANSRRKASILIHN